MKKYFFNLLNQIKKDLGITKRFILRKKKKNFNVLRFIMFSFGNYGNNVEAELRHHRYTRVEDK